MSLIMHSLASQAWMLERAVRWNHTDREEGGRLASLPSSSWGLGKTLASFFFKKKVLGGRVGDFMVFRNRYVLVLKSCGHT